MCIYKICTVQNVYLQKLCCTECVFTKSFIECLCAAQCSTYSSTLTPSKPFFLLLHNQCVLITHSMPYKDLLYFILQKAGPRLGKIGENFCEIIQWHPTHRVSALGHAACNNKRYQVYAAIWPPNIKPHHKHRVSALHGPRGL